MTTIILKDVFIFSSLLQCLYVHMYVWYLFHALASYWIAKANKDWKPRIIVGGQPLKKSQNKR